MGFGDEGEGGPLVVEVVEPPRRFSFRWNHPAGEEPVAGNSMLVEFTLVPDGRERTRLQVVESGLELLAWPDAEKDRYAEEHGGGLGHLPGPPGRVAGRSYGGMSDGARRRVVVGDRRPVSPPGPRPSCRTKVRRAPAGWRGWSRSPARRCPSTWSYSKKPAWSAGANRAVRFFTGWRQLASTRRTGDGRRRQEVGRAAHHHQATRRSRARTKQGENGKQKGQTKMAKQSGPKRQTKPGQTKPAIEAQSEAIGKTTARSVSTATEWEATRQKLLVKEKELTRARDALAAERRRMPWLAVEKDYEFDGPKGKASLVDLFDGRRQLIVYRAFFEPGVHGWPEHACIGCSMVADQVAHVAHLNARDTTLVFASRAPQPDIALVKARMGWDMPWFTMTDTFDADFGVDEWHGTNAFIRDGDRVFRTYFVNNRGDEALGSTWSYLDLTALGRQEDWEDSPDGYPQTRPYSWWIWHDEPDRTDHGDS